MKSVVAVAKNARTASRSNVFLTATLVASGRSYPVRVRNISRGGALVDAAELPDAGSAVTLQRGSLSVQGAVAWRERDHCGVRFDTPIVVAEWVRRVGYSGQEQVDKMVRLVRLPGAADEVSGVPPAGADSIGAIARDLAAACERLACIPEVVSAAPEELLVLDAIAQRLEKILRASGEPS